MQFKSKKKAAAMAKEQHKANRKRNKVKNKFRNLHIVRTKPGV